MQNGTIFERIRNAKQFDEALQPLAEELWSLREGDRPAETLELASAAALGVHFVEQGVPPSGAVREVLAIGRALVEEAESARELDGARAARLSAFVDEAAVQVAQAVELARRARRQSWISYLVHELKNPLNTVLNALWLLREKGGDPAQAARFIELAERAVRRLEGRARDVRQLDENLVKAPAGWAETHLPAAPTHNQR